MKTIIRQAIEARNIITIEYDGSSHIGEPHALGTDAEGSEYIKIYQISGFYGRWKTVPVQAINKITRLERLSFEPRGEVLDENLRFSETYCHA